MKTTVFTTLFTLLMVQFGIAQNIRAKIVDAATGDAIPYANIRINESDNLVSNGEGYFSLSENNSQDETVIVVSYLGFVSQQLVVSQLKSQDLIIKLLPAVYELQDVAVSNVKPNPYEIMANVKANLKQNYTTGEKASKEMFFYRTSSYFNPSIIDVEIDKSTGFNKQALSKINNDLQSFSTKLIKHPPVSFTDILCNYYSVKTKKAEKFVFTSKLDVLKATVLKNEGESTSLDDLEKKGRDLMLQHLDTTKFYRIKSGLIGSKDTISLRKDFNRKKKTGVNIEVNSQLTAAKSNLNSFMYQNNLLNNKRFDFIQKPELYDYTFEGTTYTNENEFAYVLTFKPRRSKAMYVGKLYISETDYAVLRTDYVLDEGEKVHNFNMKFLLGIKVSENVSKGTIIYKKRAEDDNYYMQYAATETGNYFYLNRPLKLIELTSGEKDVLALDFKIEANTRNKTEFLNMSRAATTVAAIDKIKEEDFKYLTIKAYDPKIWKDYNAIEPLQEMKQFKAGN
ncbi:carboxypeptidase-like regulatory domain-containing protein [Flavobacterium muglaense]|uniref:Carboxypeptidase-like regulatory domain-containing protein n=1 Tax=Flavobacterium muglaense TaxID=2764716 RepID=A0A923SFN2_9FLAO|nr:carboxypeptidase-like regulatory domain-containing protein [Flavobacterium muglaense]MBC5838246.1 carboxypeptidase-like regulatory domain-containing protein [Flavobacterium muglaense]MBC5844781.1 carboxypeptidase-like regulatory domain-containing protein [Flavobacterium muglaense]